MKRAVVTGGASGLGFEFCTQLRDDGFDVVMVDINERLETKAAEIGARSFHADVSDLHDMESLFEFTRREMGGLDLLINNAGILVAGDVASSAESAARVVNVNVLGVIYGCSLFSNTLVENRGAIINVASLAGVFPAPELAVYSASKAAVVAYSESLRAELPQVNVSVLCPSFTKTDLLSSGEFSDRTVDDLAAAVMKRIGANAADVVRRGLDGMERGEFMIIPQVHAKLLSSFHRTAPRISMHARVFAHRLALNRRG